MLLILNPIAGKNPKSTLIKEIDKKGQAGTSSIQGPLEKRVRFETKGEEMERESGEPEVVNDEDKSTSVARVPSFFIGKPLVDFDAGIGRVS